MCVGAESSEKLIKKTTGQRSNNFSVFFIPAQTSQAEPSSAASGKFSSHTQLTFINNQWEGTKLQ